MADKPKSSQVSLNGNDLVKHLTRAGLDPKRLDLKGISPDLDTKELESRLHGAGAAAAKGWHVTVTVSRD